MIPKIIYYTWVSNKPFPEKFKHFIDGWRKIMPAYEIIEINIDNYPHNKWTDEAVRQGKFILAGHYARCQRLYETGGIYFDIDVEAIKPFDKFLNDHFFAGIETGNIVNNAVFGCEKGHPLMKIFMDYMDNMPLNHPNIELETGPRMFSKIISEIANKNDDNIKGRVYTREYFYPYLYTEKYTPECIKENTYAIHHWGNTWGKDDYINKDLVSIIIPCYKQAEYLKDAIESCLNQSYKNVEIIVVNDGSPDNTSEVARKYPVILIEQENKGLSGAINTGIKASHGSWILTLDSDDKIDPFFIEKTINKNDIVCTNIQEFGNSHGFWEMYRNNPNVNLQSNQLHCCSLQRREIFDKIGGYDENMRLGYEDWDYWNRALHEGYKASYINEALFFYRKHGNSMVSEATKKHHEIVAYMTNKYKTLWE